MACLPAIHLLLSVPVARPVVVTRVALPPVPVSCAVLRYQEGAEGFYAVWDSWLLDTLALWQKQHEES